MSKEEVLDPDAVLKDIAIGALIGTGAMGFDAYRHYKYKAPYRPTERIAPLVIAPVAVPVLGAIRRALSQETSKMASVIDSGLIKAAAAGLAATRRLNLRPDEEEAIEQAKSQWFPKLDKDPSDQLYEDMASPLKSGLLSAVPWALGGGLAGYLAGNIAAEKTPLKAPEYSTAGALALGGTAGLAGAIYNYLQQKDENELIEEHIRSLPPFATRRMLALDPLYQLEQMQEMDKDELQRSMMARKAMMRFR